MSKTTNVLVLGATGRTGRSIVDGLIEYGGYVSHGLSLERSFELNGLLRC
jgi:hypothetical protein